MWNVVFFGPPKRANRKNRARNWYLGGWKKIGCKNLYGQSRAGSRGRKCDWIEPELAFTRWLIGVVKPEIQISCQIHRLWTPLKFPFSLPPFRYVLPVFIFLIATSQPVHNDSEWSFIKFMIFEMVLNIHIWKKSQQNCTTNQQFFVSRNAFYIKHFRWAF